MKGKSESDTHVERADFTKACEIAWDSGVKSAVGRFNDAWCTLLSDFGAPPAVLSSFRKGMTDYLYGCDEMTYWARAKNIVCFFKALYLGNPLPDVTGYAFVGHWKRWAKSRMHFTRKNTSLWSSTFKLKNAALRLSPEAAFRTMLKHSISTSAEGSTQESKVDQTVRSIMPLLEKAAESIANDYYSGKWSDPTAASNKACYESSRLNFGQIGHFMERVFGPGCPMVVPEIGFSGLGPVVRADAPLPSELTGAYDYDAYERRLRYVEREEDPSVRTRDFYSEIVIDGTRYVNCWATTYYFPNTEKYWMNEIVIDALKCLDRDQALAKVAAVLEPFKVRIITKGEAALQYLSTGFQQSAFNFNKTVPCFRLVGKAPTTADVSSLTETLAERNLEDPLWGSSDFSGASDGTMAIFRDRLLDCLVMHLPLHVRSLLAGCNGEHLVEYPKMEFDYRLDGLDDYLVKIKQMDTGEIFIYGVPPIVQKLGTLMGEKTSFIVLCYEVLAAHISSQRRCGDKRSLWRLLEEVLVNGDDRLCVTTREREAEFWGFCESYLGFKESKGKSYLHKVYANINSQSYHCDLSILGKKLAHKIPVRASGLEWGQNKLDKPFDPTSVINQILDGCHNSSMEWTVLQRFMARFKVELGQVASGRNLFFHQSIGGLGNRTPNLHPRQRCRRANGEVCGHPTNHKWACPVTDIQWAVAKSVLCEPGSFLVPEGPAPTAEIPQLPMTRQTPWDVYGKPTFWEINDRDESDLIWERYRHLECSETYNDRDFGWRHPGIAKKDLFGARRRFLQSSVAIDYLPVLSHDDSQCDVCGSFSPNAVGGRYLAQCPVCLMRKIQLLDDRGQLGYRHADYKFISHLRTVSHSDLNHQSEVLDEIELEAVDFAISCACPLRKDPWLPRPRISPTGDYVDLSGDHAEWREYNPIHLTWDYRQRLSPY